jgi:hypothetical protein
MGDGSLSNGFTGGTVTGSTSFTNGLTANTISATTYQNLPTDIRVTGGTYSAGTISFTNNTGGTFSVTGLTTGSTSNVSGDYLPLSGGTVTGGTIFTSGLTINYIDFDTTPTVPNPTGGTLYYDSTENALSYKPITPSNDVTVNLGQESLIRIYNNSGVQINNGQALHITGSTSGSPTVSLAVGAGGDNTQFQISGIATHDIPNSSFGFMTVFGTVRDINLTGFTVGEQIYLSQTVPGGLSSYSGLSITGRTCEVGHILDNSASGKLQVAILNEIEGTIITTQENNILAANNSSTGVFEFSGLSISTPSGTTFNVGPVDGWIIDNVTSTTNPTIQLIQYPGSTGNTALYVSSATETYILLTSGLTITQQTTFPTPQQRRQNLYLGKFGHGNRQFLINAFNEPDSSLSPVSQLRDMFTVIKLINDGVIASPNGANLNINTSAGVLYGLGIGYVTNKLNPNSLTISGQSPATFQYRTQTGGTSSNTTLIDPLNYDLNGVITAISGTKATNQRIYLLQNGQIRVQYGQTEYNQLAAAVAALQNEAFVTFPNFKDNGILIGILSVLSSATDLSDTSKAQFFSVSKFGELIGAAGGTSTTTLQQAYNNSSEPEILINSTLDGVSIRNGTGGADNVTSLLQGQNTSGVTTSFIRADGAFSGTSIFGTGLTATTISATTYQNLPGSSSANCVTTFFVTNISGCSPVNMLSPLNVQDGLSVTGTSTFTSQANFTGGLSASTFSANTYQNLPSFNSAQINGTPQFSGDTNNFINFSGINITITSASTNTLVFSAATGGGGVSSVTAGSGLSGNSTTGDITLTVTGVTASQITNSTTVGQNLVTVTNPSAIRYLRINADNSITTLTATQLKNDLGFYRVTLGLDVSITAVTTTLADVTGLSFPITAGSKYQFKVHLIVTTTAANTGFKCGINADVAVNSIYYYTHHNNGTTTGQFLFYSNSLDGASTNTGSFGTNRLSLIDGNLDASNTGTAIVRFGKSSANAGTLTVKAGSFIEYQIF